MLPTVRLPPHRHCKNCKAPIPEDQWYCSAECESAAKAKEKGSGRKMLWYYGLAVVAVVVIWLVILFI